MWIDDKTWNQLFELVPRVTAEAMILDEKREVVLVKRDVEPERGKWHIPGGYVRLNEKVKDTVRRRAKEETGLTVEIVDFFKVYDWAEDTRFYYPKGHIVAIAYLCKPLKGKLKKDARFFSYLTKPKIMGFGHEEYLEDLHGAGFLRT